jgi:hypothetical protein
MPGPGAYCLEKEKWTLSFALWKVVIFLDMEVTHPKF